MPLEQNWQRAHRVPFYNTTRITFSPCFPLQINGTVQEFDPNHGPVFNRLRALNSTLTSEVYMLCIIITNTELKIRFESTVSVALKISFL